MELGLYPVWSHPSLFLEVMLRGWNLLPCQGKFLGTVGGRMYWLQSLKSGVLPWGAPCPVPAPVGSSAVKW